MWHIFLGKVKITSSCRQGCWVISRKSVRWRLCLWDPCLWGPRSLTHIPEAFIVLCGFKNQSDFAAVVILESQWLAAAKIGFLLMLHVSVDGLWPSSRLPGTVGLFRVRYHFGSQAERSSSCLGPLLVVSVNPGGRISYTIGLKATSWCDIGHVCSQAIGRSMDDPTGWRWDSGRMREWISVSNAAAHPILTQIFWTHLQVRE